MRLGVSAIATSTPTGVSNQCFEALFPHTGTLGCAVSFAPPPSSPFIYMQMWGHGGGGGLLAVALPVPQSATSLDPPAATLPQVLSTRLPVSAPPTGLD